jgi:hypothetical protein
MFCHAIQSEQQNISKHQLAFEPHEDGLPLASLLSQTEHVYVCVRSADFISRLSKAENGLKHRLPCCSAPALCRSHDNPKMACLSHLPAVTNRAISPSCFIYLAKFLIKSASFFGFSTCPCTFLISTPLRFSVLNNGIALSQPRSFAGGHGHDVAAAGKPAAYHAYNVRTLAQHATVYLVPARSS